MIVDGLDEATTYSEPQRNILSMLPDGSLPANVRFLLSSRPGEHLTPGFLSQARTFWLSEDEQGKIDPHTIEDAEAYVMNLAEEEQVSEMLARRKIRPEILSERVAAASQGNFLYLYHYAQGVRDGDESLLNLEKLPQGLYGIYADFLGKIKERREDVPWDGAYKPVLGTLAVAQAPLTRRQIATFAGISPQTAGTILVRLKQFLEIMEGGADRQHALYHKSFGEYLVSEENEDYVDGVEAHRCIADYCWREYSADWSRSDAYGLRYLPAHLFKAGNAQDLHKLLCDFGWPRAKLAATDVVTLMADYNLVEQDPDMRLARDALRLSAHVLATDKAQLPGQLVGRLSSFDSASLQALVDGARAFRGIPWLCPLTPSLDAPGGPLLRTLKGRAGGHAGTPRSVAITPDGRWAISAGPSGNDQTVRVWNLETGECRHTFQNQAVGYTPVALAAAGDLAVTAYEDELRAWDLTKGVLRDSLRIAGVRVTAVALTGDGHWAIAGLANGSLRVWNLEQRTDVELPGHPEGIWAVAVTPDGKRAVSISAALVKAWNLETLREINGLQGATNLSDNWDRPAPLALASDGRQLLYGNPLKRWDVEQDAAVEVPTGDIGMILAVTPDGWRALARIDNKTLGVWDVPGCSQFLCLRHEGYVSCAAMTPDGTRAITEDTEHDLRVWDLSADVRLEPPSGGNTLDFVGFADGGQIGVFRITDESFRLWDLDASVPLPDAGADNAWVQEALSNLQQRARVQELVGQKLHDLLAPPPWNETDDPEVSTFRYFMHHQLEGLHWRVSADGKRVVSAIGPLGKSSDQEEPVRPDNTGAHPITITLPGTAELSSPESRALLTKGIVALWNLDSETSLRLLEGHSSWVTDLAITPDGKYALSGAWGRLVRAWDLDSGVQRCVLRGHGGIVSSVAIADDGRLGASASEDSTVRVWDLEAGRLIATFTDEGWMEVCWISPTGSAVVARESSGRLHILKLCGAEGR